MPTPTPGFDRQTAHIRFPLWEDVMPMTSTGNEDTRLMAANGSYWSVIRTEDVPVFDCEPDGYKQTWVTVRIDLDCVGDRHYVDVVKDIAAELSRIVKTKPTDQEED